MAQQPRSVFTGGVPYHSSADITLVFNEIRTRYNAEPEFRAAYNDDLRVSAVLGAYGISGEVQKEVLNESNRPGAVNNVTINICMTTCWFTDCVCTACCVTNIW